MVHRICTLLEIAIFYSVHQQLKKKPQIIHKQKSRLVSQADIITLCGGNNPEIFSREDGCTVCESEEMSWV